MEGNIGCSEHQLCQYVSAGHDHTHCVCQDGYKLDGATKMCVVDSSSDVIGFDNAGMSSPTREGPTSQSCNAKTNSGCGAHQECKSVFFGSSHTHCVCGEGYKVFGVGCVLVGNTANIKGPVTNTPTTTPMSSSTSVTTVLPSPTRQTEKAGQVKKCVVFHRIGAPRSHNVCGQNAYCRPSRHSGGLGECHCFSAFLLDHEGICVHEIKPLMSTKKQSKSSTASPGRASLLHKCNPQDSQFNDCGDHALCTFVTGVGSQCACLYGYVFNSQGLCVHKDEMNKNQAPLTGDSINDDLRIAATEMDLIDHAQSPMTSEPVSAGTSHVTSSAHLGHSTKSGGLKTVVSGTKTPAVSVEDRQFSSVCDPVSSRGCRENEVCKPVVPGSHSTHCVCAAGYTAVRGKCELDESSLTVRTNRPTYATLSTTTYLPATGQHEQKRLCSPTMGVLDVLDPKECGLHAVCSFVSKGKGQCVCVRGYAFGSTGLCVPQHLLAQLTSAHSRVTSYGPTKRVTASHAASSSSDVATTVSPSPQLTVHTTGQLTHDTTGVNGLEGQLNDLDQLTRRPTVAATTAVVGTTPVLTLSPTTGRTTQALLVTSAVITEKSTTEVVLTTGTEVLWYLADVFLC